ncbi:UNVERIFIED_CONTAM: hypothetical protein FKN15_021379 [Acipenser sinensis]
MSHPSWNPSKTGGENSGQVTARMETTPSFGIPSISVSQQQEPKKFAPVVAPKPKFNPYKQLEETGYTEAGGRRVRTPEKSLQERRSSLDAEIDSLTSILADLENSSPYKPRSQQVRTPEKSLQERRSSLDAEIDSLTSILADLENSSPYKPRSQQVRTPEKSLQERRSSLDAEIDSLTSILADLENSSPYKPRSQQGLSPAYNQQYPQQPSRSPGPVQYMPAQPCSPDFAYGPPQPARQPERQPEPMTSHTSPPPRAYYEPQYPGGAGQGAAYGAQNTWRPEPAYPTAVTTGPGYQLPGPRKTYITDPPPAMAPTPMAQYGAPPGMQQKGGSMPPMPPGPVPSHAAAARPEDELERLTKKMLYDMEHPPSEEYFARMFYLDSSVNYTARFHGDPWGSYQQGTNNISVAQTRVPFLILHGTSGGSMPPMPPGPVPSHAAAARPEDELERLTKKMLYDMEHPPSEEYFGRCSRCSENVVGEGSGCTAMDQVFHVECFTCVTCSRKLRGQPFYAVEKKAYCEPCYTDPVNYNESISGNLLSEAMAQGKHSLNANESISGNLLSEAMAQGQVNTRSLY